MSELPYTYERTFKEGGQRYFMGFVLGVAITIVFACQYYGYLLGHHSNIGNPIFWIPLSTEATIQWIAGGLITLGVVVLFFKNYRRFGVFLLLMAAISGCLMFSAFYNPIDLGIWLYSYINIPEMDMIHQTLALGSGGYFILVQTLIWSVIKGGIFQASGSHGTANIIDGDQLKEGTPHTTEELEGGFPVFTDSLYKLVNKLPDALWDIVKRKPYPRKKLNNGIILGRSREDDTLLRYRDNKHLVTIAPTRSGKGVGLVIPNLLDYKDNIIVFDTKGDNCDVTWNYRSEVLGQEVYVIDPFQESHYAKMFGSNSLNPLDYVQPGTFVKHGDEFIDADTGETVEKELVDTKLSEAKEYADAIASAIIPKGKKTANNKGDHWEVTGGNLLAGLIYYVASAPEFNVEDHVDKKPRTLKTVLDLLNQDKDTFTMFCQKVAGKEELPVEAKRFANSILNKADRERSSIISTAESNLSSFMDIRKIQRATDESDFNLDDVINSPSTLYIIIPADKIADYNGYLRVLVNLLLKRGVAARDTAEESQSDRKTLVMLDEFRNLGYLQPIEQAYTLLAGYGFIFWIFVQNLDNLKSLYKNEFSTFVANAGVVNAFNVNDHTTAKYLSDEAGVTTVITESKSANRQRTGAGINRTSGDSSSFRESKREVLTPDEVKRLPSDHQLIFHQGYNPALAKKIFFKKDSYLKGRFSTTDDIKNMAMAEAQKLIREDQFNRDEALDLSNCTNLAEITEAIGVARRQILRGEAPMAAYKWAKKAEDEKKEKAEEEKSLHEKIFGVSGSANEESFDEADAIDNDNFDHSNGTSKQFEDSSEESESRDSSSSSSKEELDSSTEKNKSSKKDEGEIVKTNLPM